MNTERLTGSNYVPRGRSTMNRVLRYLIGGAVFTLVGVSGARINPVRPEGYSHLESRAGNKDFQDFESRKALSNVMVTAGALGGAILLGLGTILLYRRQKEVEGTLSEIVRSLDGGGQ